MKTIVIGAGFAGTSVVRELRKLDKTSDIALVTSDRGIVYSKPMLSTAFSKKRTPDMLIQQDSGKFSEAQGVSVYTGRSVTGIQLEPQCVLLGDKTLEFDKLVLATGSVARELPFHASCPVHQINHIDHFQTFYQEAEDADAVTIIGAGLVGVELAVDVRKSGKKVNLICASDWPLQTFLPGTAGKALLYYLESIGIACFTNRKVTGIDSSSSGAVVHFCRGLPLASGCVVAAIGVEPNVELAKGMGLQVKKAIQTNDFGKTSHVDVYAIGDCAEVEEVWRPYISPITQMAKRIAHDIQKQPFTTSSLESSVVLKVPDFPISCWLPRSTLPKWVEEKVANATVFKSYIGDKLNGFILMGDQSIRQRLQEEVNASA